MATYSTSETINVHTVVSELCFRSVSSTYNIQLYLMWALSSLRRSGSNQSIMSGGVPNDWTHNENVGANTLLFFLMHITSVRSSFILVSISTQSKALILSVVQDTSGTNHMQLQRARRARIPSKPNYSLNLWSIMKNCIGKDLCKIPMPVNPRHTNYAYRLFFNIPICVSVNDERHLEDAVCGCR